MNDYQSTNKSFIVNINCRMVEVTYTKFSMQL